MGFLLLVSLVSRRRTPQNLVCAFSNHVLLASLFAATNPTFGNGLDLATLWRSLGNDFFVSLFAIAPQSDGSEQTDTCGNLLSLKYSLEFSNCVFFVFASLPTIALIFFLRFLELSFCVSLSADGSEERDISGNGVNMTATLYFSEHLTCSSLMTAVSPERHTFGKGLNGTGPPLRAGGDELRRRSRAPENSAYSLTYSLSSASASRRDYEEL